MENSELIKLHQNNGGLTYSVALNRIIDNVRLYAVGILPERSLITEDITEDKINSFIENNSDFLQNSDYAIGTWHNPEDNKDYIDIVELIRTKKIAIKEAKKYNQIGIFDLFNHLFIETGGSGLA